MSITEYLLYLRWDELPILIIIFLFLFFIKQPFFAHNSSKMAKNPLFHQKSLPFQHKTHSKFTPNSLNSHSQITPKKQGTHSILTRMNPLHLGGRILTILYFVFSFLHFFNFMFLLPILLVKFIS